MKGFLFDENLPSRLTFRPALPVIPSSALGDSVTDTRVWEAATRDDLCIVTKDGDFSGRMLLHTPPPG